MHHQQTATCKSFGFNNVYLSCLWKKVFRCFLMATTILDCSQKNNCLWSFKLVYFKNNFIIVLNYFWMYLLLLANPSYMLKKLKTMQAFSSFTNNYWTKLVLPFSKKISTSNLQQTWSPFFFKGWNRIVLSLLITKFKHKATILIAN